MATLPLDSCYRISLTSFETDIERYYKATTTLTTNLSQVLTNGVLMDIKVVPGRNRPGLAAGLAGNNKSGSRAPENRGGIVGRPYYLTPADGSPHYSDLQNADRLYPQWVIKDF